MLGLSALAPNTQHQQVTRAGDRHDVVDSVDLCRRRLGSPIFDWNQPLEGRVADELEDVFGAQRLARHRFDLAALLGRRSRTALEDDFGHVATIEVLEKLL